MTEYDEEYCRRLEKAVTLFDDLLEAKFLERFEELVEKISTVEMRMETLRHALGIEDCDWDACYFNPNDSIIDKIERFEYFIKMMGMVSKRTINDQIPDDWESTNPYQIQNWHSIMGY